MPVDVEIAGLRELSQMLRSLEIRLPREISSELREAARLVQREAQVVAGEEGLTHQRAGDKARESASLVQGLRVRVRGTAAYVADVAARTVGKNSPFNYARLYEYVLHRPFLRPALERRRSEIEERMNAMLARLVAGR